MMVLAISACLMLTTAVLGQRSTAPATQVDPSEALKTFDEVSKWLEAWETPTDAALPKGCVGVWVGIRFAGRPMGAGSSIDATNLDKPSTRALTGATRRAMSSAYQTAGGVDDSDVRADKREAFLASPFRTLEIDFAHSPKRIRATSLDRVLENIRPGIDGLLLRRGAESYAVFPAEMLAFDTRPSSAIVSLLSACGVSIDRVDLEIGDGTIRIWSFETLHLAQATRNGPASFLYRGSRPVPLESIDVAEIRAMADSAAAYLERTTLPFPEDPHYRMLLGDYLPHSDRRLQDRGSLADHALTALALLRYSSVAKDQPAAASTARSAAIGLLNLLSSDEATRLVVGQDARASALVHLALQQLDSQEMTDELRDLATAVQDGAQRAYRTDRGFGQNLSPEDRALVAAALGTREVVDAAWRSAGVELQPLLMPWLCLAEIELARDGSAIPSLPALRGLRDRLLAAQPGRLPGEAVEPDLIGALRYRPTIEPDWHAAQLVTFCALMLGNAQCTPAEEKAAQILNLQRSMRFLRQLQVRDADRYRTRNPDLATGGVRTGVCDQTMPTAATASVLLATVTTLEAFDDPTGAGQ